MLHRKLQILYYYLFIYLKMATEWTLIYNGCKETLFNMCHNIRIRIGLIIQFQVTLFHKLTSTSAPDLVSAHCNLFGICIHVSRGDGLTDRLMCMVWEAALTPYPLYISKVGLN